DAAFTAVTHVGLCALRQARYEPGERIAVIGLGIIGLCTVALARAMGAPVAALGNSPLRVDLAKRAGADVAVLVDDPHLPAALRDWSTDLGIDLVVNTANPWSAHRLATDIARENGRIAYIGFPGRNEPPPDF